MQAIAAASAARALLRPPSHPAALSLARPFAARTLASAAAGPSDDGKLTPEQEHKKRIDMMFAEKTLREVEAAGAERRPEGVSHVLESDESQTAAASAHSADRGEVGGRSSVKMIIGTATTKKVIRTKRFLLKRMWRNSLTASFTSALPVRG